MKYRQRHRHRHRHTHRHLELLPSASYQFTAVSAAAKDKNYEDAQNKSPIICHKTLTKDPHTHTHTRIITSPEHS